ncbi:organic hydroperoxide resistance protein [Microbacterium sp. LBN7]
MPHPIRYTAEVHTTGGRDGGTARSDDGALDVSLSSPPGLGGRGGSGTNPEQLLAAGYSACFISAMNHVSTGLGIRVPADTSIDASVSVGPTQDGAFGLAVRLEVHLPGLASEDAQRVVDAAHYSCPYSNALRGNAPVEILVV